MANLKGLQLVAVGDVALNGGYEELARRRESRHVLGCVAPLLQHADLAIGNLEGPLTQRRGVSPPWRFCLRGHPSYAPLLRAAGFRILSLANNHIMDYGWEAVEETMDHLSKAGIRTVGVGKDLTTAREPLFVTGNGSSLAILAYCSVAVGIPLYAGARQPGVAPLRLPYIVEDVGKARRDADFVLVCLHWGQEHVTYPAPRHRRLARAIIDAGADLIIGHHPHVLQGVEIVGKGLVAYSLGNFMFSEEEWLGVDPAGNGFRLPFRLNEAARRTVLLKVGLAAGNQLPSVEWVPAYLGRDLHTIPDLRRERHEDLDRLSGRLGRAGYGLLWSSEMVRSRARAFIEEVSADGGGLWKRLPRLRPRHLSQVARVIAREWEQFRGAE